MKKMIAYSLMAAITVTMLAGCGGKPPENPAPPAQQNAAATPDSKPKETVKVDLWHSMAGSNGEAIAKVAEDFNATVGKEKGIQVNAVYQGNDVVEKLKTVAQANDIKNYPDVGQIFGSGIPAVLKMKPTVPVEEMYSKGGASVAKADIEPAFSRAFTYQNKLIGMPFNCSTILIYYNKNMFKEVGLDPEKPPKTIDEMAQYITKLMKVNGNKVERYGLNVAVRRYQLANFIGGQGSYNFIGDNEGGRTGPMTKVTFGEDGSLRKYLTEWQKVINTGGYKAVENNINEEFASGLFGMAIMSTARISIMSNLTKGKFEFGVGYLPKVDANDKGGTSVGGASLCLFNRGDDAKLKAAWEFVQYAASPEAQFKFHVNTGYIPVNKKAYDLPDMQKYLKDNPAYKVAIDQLHNSSPNVQEPFDIIPWELDAIMASAMADFASGKMTLEQAHDYIVKECNAKLSAYHKANS